MHLTCRIPRHLFITGKRRHQSLSGTRRIFPIVAKSNIGASGNGVIILLHEEDAGKYIRDVFSKGVVNKTGPKLGKGNIFVKLKKILTNKGFVIQRISDYYETFNNPQKGFVIFQEYIPHNYEWRVVRIGESYFAHKKIAIKNKASGTLVKAYDEVPLELLDFVKNVTENTGISSVAIDIFEYEKKYLINEVQCFFGQSDPYQMLKGEKPGRYIFKNGQWEFEQGIFNTNQSYNLRLDHALSIITSEK